MPKVAFTAARLQGFTCPPDRAQAFLWDATVRGLGLRVTAAKGAAYVFQSKFQGADLRITIGTREAWSIRDAQDRARELQRMIDQGIDPREQKRERRAQAVATKAAAAVQAVTVGEAWAAYCTERAPHWGERHRYDHQQLSKAGGEPAKRGVKPSRPGAKAMTVAGPLYPLLALKLSDLTPERVTAWAAKEAKTRPTRARLAWRCLKVFLNWCAVHPAYQAAIATTNPAASRKARDALGRPNVKADVLLREQLPAWFAAVRQLGNPTVSAYLQALLLTGARPGEVITLRWADLNLQWRSLAIRDKVEGERVIPLTPYVLHLLAALPRRSEWVFASASNANPITSPNHPHGQACKVAAIEGLTLHGLRRSFGSLCEWQEIPAGIVAQIMGHKPSATAEKHYRVRPLDLLRLHHERIEAWILEQAGVRFDAAAAPGGLRVVA